MATFYCGFLKEPTGVMKIILLALSLVDLLLARTGFQLIPYILTVDGRWLAYFTCGSYVLILSVLILSMIFSNEISFSADLLFSFIGAILYIATGAMSIKTFEPLIDDYRRKEGLAFGGMCIITGVFFIIHLALLIKSVREKKSTI